MDPSLQKSLMTGGVKESVISKGWRGTNCVSTTILGMKAYMRLLISSWFVK